MNAAPAAPPAPTTDKETTTVPTPPRADCIADSAGGITFDIADRTATDNALAWGAALVLRRRGGDSSADEVRLPLAPAAVGLLRAVLPSTVWLPEGRWNAFAAVGEAEPQRLLPGVNDLRSLVDRKPGSGVGLLGVRIPYETKAGNLALRSWLRGPHAEAGEILVDEHGATVHGRLYGTGQPPGGRALARCRRDPSLELTVPVVADGPDFSFTLPYTGLAEHWEGGADAWDLWLLPAAEADAAADHEPEAVRVARILDDVADKKLIFSYPASPVKAPYGDAQAGPYYTVDNDLSIRIDAPPTV
ncbi:hypothetical protein [Streptomyces sp. H27-D2]|uniref:hypothetical protein n=1 Tax=Streptomyces sp. H27-D2 TaxID=3046304 RepID=UPI002DBAD983|nr:hypothetical protein [Streptomyces sp. H27-D2]MEC4019588.1 hypothetical protein [Streptomyces sp. H27-D2]